MPCVETCCFPPELTRIGDIVDTINFRLSHVYFHHFDVGWIWNSVGPAPKAVPAVEFVAELPGKQVRSAQFAGTSSVPAEVSGRF